MTGQGRGTQVLPPFDHDGGVVVVAYQQDAEAPFTVRAVQESGGPAVELVTETDLLRGQRAAALPAGRWALEVRGSGTWDLELTRPRPAEPAALPLTVEGDDEAVTEPFSAPAEFTLQWAHENGLDGQVRLVDEDGEEVESLTIGPGEQVAVAVDPGVYLVEVRTLGVWRLIIG